MDYNKKLQELKQKYFPELNGYVVILKRRENQKSFMGAYPLNEYIYYNEEIMKNCNPKARDSAFIHELYHKLQFFRMAFIKRVIILRIYLLSQKMRIKIEREANIETVKRGFGEGLILLNEYVKKRVGKERWENGMKDLHLTEKEIRSFMRRFSRAEK